MSTTSLRISEYPGRVALDLFRRRTRDGVISVTRVAYAAPEQSRGIAAATDDGARRLQPAGVNTGRTAQWPSVTRIPQSGQ